MIIFCRGLVLRLGDRQLEFERDLGDGRVQFKFMDNFEVRTYQIAKLYKEIQSKRFVPVSKVIDGKNDKKLPSLPVHLPSEQVCLIAFRMKFVREVLKSPTGSFSRRWCEKVAQDVWLEIVRLDPKLPVGTTQLKCPTGATLERWAIRYRDNDSNPYALIDKRAIAIKPKRIESRVEIIVDSTIAKHYLKIQGVTVRAAHKLIVSDVARLNKQEGLSYEAPSERTINRRVLCISPYVRDLRRIGPAYARNKWRYSLKGDISTRIMERVEVDHTLLDIWVVDPQSGLPLGRPWITLLIDRYSGYLLGFYISFYGPSSATVARALKVSIEPKEDWVASLGTGARRWSAMGTAELYVVDNGLEFHSERFMRIAWELRSDITFNPVRQPWFKPAIERAVMESNRALPTAGRVYKPISNAAMPDPSKTAAIMFDDLCLCLLDWASQKYPLQIHSKTLCRPQDLWDEGLDECPPTMLPLQLDGLDLLCGLSAHRKVDGDGVFFRYLRFNSVELQDYFRTYGAFRTEIRFNPDDLRQLHVLLPKAKTWLSVPLQRPFHLAGNAVSLVQLQIAREEAGKRLTRANAHEELERATQRLQERWADATKRGSKVRKDNSLVRMQALTSASFSLESSKPKSLGSESPLELSPVLLKALPKIVPFESFTLEED